MSDDGVPMEESGGMSINEVPDTNVRRPVQPIPAPSAKKPSPRGSVGNAAVAGAAGGAAAFVGAAAISSMAASSGVCPACSATNAADAKFCSKCATELTGVVICEKCDKENAPGSKFCSGCGETTEKQDDPPEDPNSAWVEEAPSEISETFDPMELRVGRGQRRKRKFRFCLLLLFVAIVILAWALSDLTAYWDLSKPFDAAAPLSIQSIGCDVHLKNGPNPTVRLRLLRDPKTSHAFVWDAAVKNVVGLRVTNSDCSKTVPRFNCRPRCYVEITSPPGTGDITIVQAQSDAHHILVTGKGAHINSLVIKGPAASTSLEGVRIQNNAQIWVSDGTMTFRDTTWSTSSLRTSLGDVYIYDTENSEITRGIEDNVDYRTTDYRACFRSSHGVVTPASDPWMNCDLNTDKWAFKAIAAMDLNKDYRIDTNEVGDYMTSLARCCGGLCPRLSLCAGNVNNIFPYDPTSSDRQGILNSGPFVSALQLSNETNLVPFCTRRVDISVPTYVDTRQSNIHTKNGQIRVERTGSNVMTEWFEPGSVSGVKLFKGSYDALVALREKFGALTSIQHAYVVINVLESPGVEAGLYVWATRLAYVNLEPVHLEALTFGLLVPEIIRVKARFQNGDCELPSLPANATEEMKTIFNHERRVPVWKAIKAAITPLGAPTRGTLVQIMPGHLPNKHKVDMFIEDFSTGEVHIVPWDAGRRGLTRGVALLSVAIGAAFGIFATMAFFLHARQKLEMQRMRDRVKKRIALLERGVDPGQTRKKTAKKKVSCASEDETLLALGPLDADEEKRKLINPFEWPFVVINTFVVQPIRRRFTDSINRFVLERCLVIPMGQRTKDTVLDYDDFENAYARFCFNEDIEQIIDQMRVSQYLITHHNLRVHQVNHQRLRGVKWLESLDFSQVVRSINLPGPAHEMDTSSLLQVFVNTFIVVTRHQQDFILYKDIIPVAKRNDDAGGALRVDHSSMGFFDVFTDFCQQLNISTPEITPAMLTQLGIQLSLKKKRTIRGVELLNFQTGHRAKLGWQWYLMEAVVVVVHICSLFALPGFVISRALLYHWIFSYTTSTGDAATPFDLIGFPPDVHNKVVLVETKAICISQLVVIFLASIYLILEYCQLNSMSDGGKEESRLLQLIRKVFAVFFMVYFWMIGSYACIVCTWLLLAAALDPVNFLPQGAAVVTVVAVATLTRKQLMAVALALQLKFKKAFKKYMKETLDTSKRLMDSETYQDDPGRERLADDKNRAGTTSVIESNQEVDIGDLFEMLNVDGDEELDYDEFCDLFDKLGFNVPEMRRAQMFAFADVDGSGAISAEEFQTAWAYLEEELVTAALESVGVSDLGIAFIIIVIVLLCSAVFTFLFLALTVWSGSGGFESVVQTLVVTFGGFVMSYLRSQPTAEAATEEELDSVVDSSVATIS